MATFPEKVGGILLTFFIPMKWLSLILLVVQTVSVVLVMRLSRITQVNGPRYLNTTAVFFAELLKLLCSFMFLCHERGSIKSAGSLVWQHFRRSPGETLKVSVPSLLYTVQNNLLFVSLSNLSSAVYQVTYQLKILTTALFSVAILGKTLGPTKWGALVTLTVGVAVILLPKDEHGNNSTTTFAPAEGNATVGIVAVLSACLTSGLASVFLERILKKTDASIWLRNIQLAFFGMVLALIGVFLQDGAKINEAGFLQGYSMLVWLVIFLQAVGGLVVAAVLKYADNILKCFGNALSIILSGVLSAVYIGEFVPDARFVVGTLLVLAATTLYSTGVPDCVLRDYLSCIFTTTASSQRYLDLDVRTDSIFQGKEGPGDAVFKQFALMSTKC